MAPEHSLALSRQRAARARRLQPRRLRLLPHAADPLPARRHARGSARRRSPGRRASTIRICGARAASGPTSRARAARAPQDWHFAHLFCAARASCPIRSCRRIDRCSTDRRSGRGRRRAISWRTSKRSAARASSPAPRARPHAREACNCPDDEMAQMAFSARRLNRASGATAAETARSRLCRRQPTRRAASSSTRANCASCHGVARRRRRTRRGRAAAASRPIWPSHDYSLARLVRRAVERRGRHRDAGVARPLRRRISPRSRSRCGALRASTRRRRRPTRRSTWLNSARACTRPTACSATASDGDGAARPRSRSCAWRRRVSAAQRPSLAESLRALRNGVEGTPMAPWTDRA